MLTCFYFNNVNFQLGMFIIYKYLVLLFMVIINFQNDYLSVLLIIIITIDFQNYYLSLLVIIISIYHKIQSVGTL